MNANENREEAIVQRALQIANPEERAAYLEKACGADPQVRQRIEARLLLREQGAQPGETSNPISGEAPDTPRTGSDAQALIGSRIGRYKLVEVIGQGGFGTVYRAEQEEPVRRQVALKVIKLGMDTQKVIARFEAERQALALMDHPNIAKVFDAGTTDTGRPYFVMELVPGPRITEYCDRVNLPARERLQLFIQVCHAVQHAHQKGIIHRDLKPSNILVTFHDGQPAPKVIDFGIAKATEQRLTDQTLATAVERFLGTPAYMSPEQAGMSGMDLDTRADIYSLGVLLYELLTGQTPFDQRELLAAGLEEMRRIIREQEPARPSTRLSALEAEEQTSVARRRQSEPPKLLHLIRGDLDWIVMKCLEKDRARRYETANGLASDLERHLGNEPVVARPPSRLYRFQKLVRRNRLGFAAASAVTAALVIGLSVSLWMFFREREARQRAVVSERQQARLRAEAEAARKAETLLRQEAEAAEEKRRQLLSEFADNVRLSGPLISSEWAREFGTSLRELRKGLEASLASDQTRWPNESEKWEWMLRTVADTLQIEGEYAKAEQVLRDLLAIIRKRCPNESEKWVETLDSLALVLRRQGKYAEAAQIVRLDSTHFEIEEFRRDLLKSDQTQWPNEPSRWLPALNHLAVALEDAGRHSDVEEVFGDALALDNGAHANNATLLFSRGFFRGWHGQWKAAASDLTKALQAEPSRHWTWYLLALVLVQNEDLPAFQKHRQAMLARFGATESLVAAHLTAVVCACRPVAGDELEKASKLADKALSMSMLDMSSPEYGGYPWPPLLLFGKGLTAYRQEHFDRAVVWLERAVAQVAHETVGNKVRYLRGESAVSDLDLIAQEAQILFVLAMARHELKERGEAREALGRGMQLVRTRLPPLSSGDLSDQWADILIANSLMREAMQVIVPTTFSVDDLVDLPRLAHGLKLRAGLVCRYLAKHLSSETKAALSNYQGKGSDPGALQAGLVQDLNSIIRGPVYAGLVHELKSSGRISMGEAQRIVDLEYGESDTWELLQQVPKEGEDLVRLNRLLIEDTFLGRDKHYTFPPPGVETQ